MRPDTCHCAFALSLLGPGNEKQKNLWQKRLNGLKKLKTGLETSGRPHAPSKVSIYIDSRQY